jgi:hypothetical protein
MAGQRVNVAALVPRGAGQAQMPSEDHASTVLISFRPCDDRICALPSHDRLDHHAADWSLTLCIETADTRAVLNPFLAARVLSVQDQHRAYSVSSRSLAAGNSVSTRSRSLVGESVSRKIFRPPVRKSRESRERERRTVPFSDARVRSFFPFACPGDRNAWSEQ